nr:Hypothetical protein SC2p2_00080 [Methylocystis sp. SC2]
MEHLHACHDGFPWSINLRIGRRDRLDAAPYIRWTISRCVPVARDFFGFGKKGKLPSTPSGRMRSASETFCDNTSAG